MHMYDDTYVMMEVYMVGFQSALYPFMASYVYWNLGIWFRQPSV